MAPEMDPPPPWLEEILRVTVPRVPDQRNNLDQFVRMVLAMTPEHKAMACDWYVDQVARALMVRFPQQVQRHGEEYFQRHARQQLELDVGPW